MIGFFTDKKLLNHFYRAALVNLLGMSFTVFTGHSTLAQITPDSTLGTEGSIVTPNRTVRGLPADVIEGGATRGTNLFHSFLEFNVGQGQGVYFANPAQIENILTRVTGGNPSNILGILGVLGNANLFLINPSGIFWGPKASLDVNGSFLATTADGIKLGENGYFSATDPQNSSLLSVSPEALFFNQVASQNTRSIEVQESLLQVAAGKTLALVGGNVIIDGASLSAPGGRVELGGALGEGTVGLNIDNSGLSLNFSESFPRADVSLDNQADVNVRAGGGGSIAVHARDFQVLGGSSLRAGIAANQGSVDSQAGNIEIDATGALTVKGSSILNTVRPKGIGNGGDIIIKTGSLSVLDGGELNTSTSGQGDGGNITIHASKAISLAGEDRDGFSSGIFSNVRRGAVGKGGNIEIDAESLSLKDGAEISASTLGQGDAGNVTLQIRGPISLDGQTSNNFSSVIHSDVYGVGNGGNVKVTAESLTISNGASLSATTGGQGNSGDINIQVNTLSLDGLFSGIAVGVGDFEGVPAVGNGGNIKITADSVSLNNGASIQLSTAGQGNVGDLNLQARTLSLTGGAEIQGGAFGLGNAGDITLNVSESINLSGIGLSGASSGLFSATREGSEGNGGNITVNTGVLHITDGAVIGGRSRTSYRGGNIIVNTNTLEILGGGQILTTAYSSGQAGNITINARDPITIAGSDPTFDARLAQFGRPIVDPASSASGLFADTTVNSTGQGGRVMIQTPQLTIQDGAQVSTATFGKGNSGNIDIQTRVLDITNASITSSTSGQGNGGNISIGNADSVSLDNNSAISTAVKPGAVGQGGKIELNTRSLTLTNGAQLNASTSGQGNGGNISVGNADSVSLDNGSAISTAVNPGAVGQGGKIELTTRSLTLTNGAQLNASTSGQGNGGNISVGNADSVSLDNGSAISTAVNPGAVGNGGDIKIQTGLLSLTNGARMRVSTSGRGDGGNFSLEGAKSVFLSKSSIGTVVGIGGVGNGGNIRIQAELLSLIDAARLTAATAGNGNAGNIFVVDGKSVSLTNSSTFFTGVTPEGVGRGGQISVNTGFLSLNNSSITSSSQGTGQAGNISITAQNLHAHRGEITAQSQKAGGGNINITAKELLLENSSLISTSVAQSTGGGGDIDLKADKLIVLEDSDILANADEGPGGNIKIDSRLFIADLFSTAQGGGQGSKLNDFSQFRGNGQVDISASSRLGISGVVNIPDFTFLQNSLSQLSGDFVPPEQVIASSCLAHRNVQRGSFTVTGTGGFPTNPYEAIGGQYRVTTVQGLTSEDSRESNFSVVSPTLNQWKLGEPVVEAQGMTVTADGRVIVGTAPQLAVAHRAEDLVCH